MMQLHFDQNCTSTKNEQPITDEWLSGVIDTEKPISNVRYQLENAVVRPNIIGITETISVRNAVARPNIIGTTENNYWNNVCKCAYLTNLKWLELICQAS